jgi:cytochrome c peroxidase
MRRFQQIGCASCHNGINLGGNSYQKPGSAVPYYDNQRNTDLADPGVMERSDRQRDRYVFRVPGLHGVATTSPYFHDGSVATLEEAIALMARHELARELDERDVDDIEAFLRSLGGNFTSGRSPGASLAAESSGERDGRTADTQQASHEQAYRAAVMAIGHGPKR